ncbi:MAG: hypothetical protein LBE12_14040 [Planctomycetaceae bacterium]|nr:hypothetical protein [Planctomycetaceae bacterium]
MSKPCLSQILSEKQLPTDSLLLTDPIRSQFQKHQVIKPCEMSIVLSSSQASYKTGELITVDVSIVNTTTDSKLIPYGNLYPIFFLVSKKSGQEIISNDINSALEYIFVHKDQDKARFVIPPGSTRYHLSEPNNVYKQSRIVSSQTHDFSLDGTYYIRAVKAFNIFQPEMDKVVLSNELKIVVISNTEGNKIFVNFTKKWNKYQYGVALSFLADKEKYEDYCPIYIQLATKNSQTKPISMQEDVTNIFDVYGLTLKTPGLNRDFHKPRGNGDVQNAALTLYGQKLFSEKSKDPKPMVTVKPEEEVAETVIVLNQIFDMSEDGIYGLIVSRKIIDENGKEQTVTSDPLPIRVGTALTQDEIDQRIKKERQEKEKNTKK